MQNILQTCLKSLYSYVFKYKFLHCLERYNYIRRGACTKFVYLHEVGNKTFKVSPLFTQAYDRYHLGRCRDERGN